MISHNLASNSLILGPQAEALQDIAENALEGEPLLDDMDDYTVDSGVAKLRISYEVYLGEEQS